ncbi:MAG TPA: 1-(5-phosphoribosyl)-5-[(5-phosphoribosylamino)methylideneamino]imidazole-4-carboxamide isomerase [Gammaproteobacteria bacterium]|nr:1-(5-phosphoribosyl)-5-[(5-phosphoribosylamino)methylideneamino]imidazole-4-carboxamide isomerase [Gammaproteobacteria bacterium]
MKLYPAIDLKSGTCVRLYKGSFDHVTAYQASPLSVAENFASEGADFLHIIDLDGAQEGTSKHTSLVLDIIEKTRLSIQLGGGIRSYAQLSQWLHNGVTRVILGSIALSEPEKVNMWLREFGAERIVLALDIRMNSANEPILASHGWQQNSGMSLWHLLDLYQDSPLKHVLCTDIDCDGTLAGPNISLYQQCSQRYPNLDFQASGGVSSLADLRTLAQMQVSGVIVGKALYERKFSLSEALIELSHVS